MRWQHAIYDFLCIRLRLELHPDKIVLQRCTQGIDFLGSIVFPNHCLTWQRSVRALRRRIAWLNELIFSGDHQPRAPQTGNWQRWLKNNTPFIAPGIPSVALLQRMLATLNSYYGQFGHADTYRLRRHNYQKELGPLQAVFSAGWPGLPALAYTQSLACPYLDGQARTARVKKCRSGGTRLTTPATPR